MKRKTREQMVIEIYDREAMGEVTARELAIINQGLLEEFGEGGQMSPGQIAHVLLAEDLPVRLDHVLLMMTPTEKYENIFGELIGAESLAEAEDALRQIDEWRRKFERLGDRTGVRFALEAARQSRQLALDKTAWPGLTAAQKIVQAEIAEWVRVWLESPSLFPQWLELRKSAPEFKEKFGESPQNWPSSASRNTHDAEALGEARQRRGITLGAGHHEPGAEAPDDPPGP